MREIVTLLSGSSGVTARRRTEVNADESANLDFVILSSAWVLVEALAWFYSGKDACFHGRYVASGYFACRENTHLYTYCLLNLVRLSLRRACDLYELHLFIMQRLIASLHKQDGKCEILRWSIHGFRKTVMPNSRNHGIHGCGGRTGRMDIRSGGRRLRDGPLHIRHRTGPGW